MPLGASIAIAKRSLRIWIYKIKYTFQPSIISSVGRAVDSGVNSPGFDTRHRQWNCFKNYKILFLNEDIVRMHSASACIDRKKSKNWLFIAEIKNLEVFWKGETIPNIFWSLKVP